MNASDDTAAPPPQAPNPSAPPPAGPPPRLARRAWGTAIFAGAIVLGLWGPNLLRPPPPAWTSYISLKGQTRRLRLADKSLLWMNGASSVRVMFDERVRRAVFDGGEAELALASSARPLEMQAGDREIRARSADFDLRRYGPMGKVASTLTVRRGRAEVGWIGKADVRILGPGDQLSWVDGQPAAPARRVDAAAALAWQSRRLVYDRAPLSQVAEDLNRYLDRPIVVVPSADALLFTGTLPLDSEDRILKRLQAALPVRARISQTSILLARAP